MSNSRYSPLLLSLLWLLDLVSNLSLIPKPIYRFLQNPYSPTSVGGCRSQIFNTLRYTGWVVSCTFYNRGRRRRKRLCARAAIATPDLVMQRWKRDSETNESPFSPSKFNGLSFKSKFLIAGFRDDGEGGDELNGASPSSLIWFKSKLSFSDLLGLCSTNDSPGASDKGYSSIINLNLSHPVLGKAIEAFGRTIWVLNWMPTYAAAGCCQPFLLRKWWVIIITFRSKSIEVSFMEISPEIVSRDRDSEMGREWYQWGAKSSKTRVRGGRRSSTGAKPEPPPPEVVAAAAAATGWLEAPRNSLETEAVDTTCSLASASEGDDSLHIPMGIQINTGRRDTRLLRPQSPSPKLKNSKSFSFSDPRNLNTPINTTSRRDTKLLRVRAPKPETGSPTST